MGGLPQTAVDDVATAGRRLAQSGHATGVVALGEDDGSDTAAAVPPA
jgi:hypothetical protein